MWKDRVRKSMFQLVSAFSPCPVAELSTAAFLSWLCRPETSASLSATSLRQGAESVTSR